MANALTAPSANEQPINNQLLPYPYQQSGLDDMPALFGAGYFSNLFHTINMNDAFNATRQAYPSYYPGIGYVQQEFPSPSFSSSPLAQIPSTSKQAESRNDPMISANAYITRTTAQSKKNPGKVWKSADNSPAIRFAGFVFTIGRK